MLLSATHRRRGAVPRCVLLLWAVLALAGLPAARPPQADGPALLLSDVVPGSVPTPPPSIPAPVALAPAGGQLFLINYDRNNGYELWRSDGSPAGTRLVKDMCAGRADTQVVEAVAAGDTLFLIGACDGGPQTLWRSDGSPAGTFQLKAQGSERLGVISDLRAVGGTLFFLNLAPAGLALWKSDGSEAGTRKVADLAGSIEDTYGLVGASERLFFVSNDGTHGRELWQSDGSAVGTRMVADLNPSGDAFPTRHPEEGASLQMTAVGAAVFFAASDGARSGLWRSQGVEAGVTYLAEVALDGGVALGADLWFSTPAGGLWKSDGTPAGTRLLKEGLSPAALTGFGGAVFFVNIRNSTLGDGELWKSDGTPAGTLKVSSVSPLAFTYMAAGLSRLFLFGTAESGESEVWVSDGSGAGTARLIDLNPGGDDAVGFLGLLGDRLLFAGSDGRGRAAWVSDGGAAGTRLLADTHVAPRGLTDLNMPRTPDLTTLGDQLLFSADAVLWHSDGTPGGTAALGNPNGPVLELTAGDGAVFFASSVGFDQRLWRSDGTRAGTTLLKEFGLLAYGPSDLVFDQGLLYAVTGDSSAAGYQIWRSDGTPAGTLPLVSLARSAGSPGNDAPEQLTALAGRLFFSFDDGLHGRELWVSDGTQAGTRLVSDLNQGPASARPFGLSVLDGALVFGVTASGGGDQPARGYGLWRSDGTPGGTVPLVQFGYGAGDPAPAPGVPARCGVRLCFTAWDAEAGTELWASDGSAAGTQRLKDLNSISNPANDGSPGQSATGSSMPHDLAPVGGTLFFAANDGVHGDELWKSDGTAEGTVLVRDLYPGPLGAAVGPILALPDARGAVFAGSDGLSGVELWVSDGSASGTRLLSDLAGGPGSSNPLALARGRQLLFFVADNGSSGPEPWALRLGGPPRVFLPLVRR